MLGVSNAAPHYTFYQRNEYSISWELQLQTSFPSVLQYASTGVITFFFFLAFLQNKEDHDKMQILKRWQELAA